MTRRCCPNKRPCCRFSRSLGNLERRDLAISVRRSFLSRTKFTQECIEMLGPLVVVAIGFQLPCGRQPVTARAAGGVAMSSTTDLDDVTRDAEPRLDGRVDDPAAKPTAAQSQAYQAALESGPPSGSVPVAYQSTRLLRPSRRRRTTASCAQRRPHRPWLRGRRAGPPRGTRPRPRTRSGEHAHLNPHPHPHPHPAPAPAPDPDPRSLSLSLTRVLTLTPTLTRSTRAVRVLGPLALFAGSVCCFVRTPSLTLTRS